MTASEGVLIQRHRLPARVQGDYQTIAVRVQAMTGLGLEPGGGILVLDMAGWRHAKQRSGTPLGNRRLSYSEAKGIGGR